MNNTHSVSALIAVTVTHHDMRINSEQQEEQDYTNRWSWIKISCNRVCAPGEPMALKAPLIRL
ncbi:hypothetical protein LL969_03610 [Xanthomonas campestris pv. phormiicola]|nr:hypothetical protein [Xanthomonas campestris pv. phormiicola]